MSDLLLLKGNEAFAEAAIIAGCRHYYAYPITPQNEVVTYMAKRMPEVQGSFIQAESELAAISMVMGAAAAGARAMTSSSSPGISLMQEGLSYLAGSELPCVIANIMRGGPGLGGIAGSQGDYYQSTRGGGQGDYRTIVLAPGSAQELADFTIRAFDLADKYRIPVIILADGYLGQVSEPVRLPKATGKKFEKSWAVTGAKGRKRNIVASLRLFPDNALEKHNLHLEKKHRTIAQKECTYESWKAEDADWLITAFGTPARVARKAVDHLRKEGIKAGLFRPTTLWPFPEAELQRLAGKCRRVLVVEMNLGQMLDDVKLATSGLVDIDFHGRAGGAVPALNDIIERIKKYERNNSTIIQAS